MTGLKQAFLTFFVLACCLISVAQQPSSYKLGEEELSGIDIYDILQDNLHNYWLATDNGLIKYDGYSFKKIPSNNALINSVFDLQLDYHGDVFCKNLSGQIFRVQNDFCEVFFQIPDSLIRAEYYYAFDNLNRLTIASNSIFNVDKDKKILSIISKNTIENRFYQLLQLKDSSIVAFNVGHHDFIKIKNDSCYITKIKTPNPYHAIQGIYINNQLLYYVKGTGMMLKRNNNSFELNNEFYPVDTKGEILRYYADNNNLWIARLAGGIKVFDKTLKPLFNNNTFFKNNVISSFCNDDEGNIILGTFGEGLIVIPNLNIVDVKLPDINAKITRITSTPENTFFFGSQDGQIFKKEGNNQTKPFIKSTSKNIEVLYYIDKSNELLIESKTPLLVNLTNGNKRSGLYGAIKDVTKVSDNLYLVASNMGVCYFSPAGAKSNSELTTHLDNFTERTNCVNYDPNTQSIYAGTSQGLKIGNATNNKRFLFNGVPVIARDILYFESKIYITTQKNGVLIFANDELIENWTTNTNLISNSVKNIKSYGNKLFLTTDLGIQILDSIGNHLFTLNKAEGLYVNQVIDFEIRNNLLFAVHQKGVQQINIAHLIPFNFQPTISLTQVLLNDSNFTFSNHTTLAHHQNKLEFIVASNSIKFNTELSYIHKLEGLDNTWQENQYHNNKITYKSLPPGDYVFKVKAICRKRESSLLAIPFTIAEPFWNTIWFYLVIALFFVASTLYTARIQVKKQKKKIKLENELYASKLIAIKSQMNPHFIFNAINSIQDLILKGDIDNSYNYIIKFSKLVRQTLHFSDKEFIDIEDEIELLTIYLELEKLRFKTDFQYTITLENVEDVQVPPMLIQPFVENAIKHGLLHKKGPKTLSISFCKNDTVQCTITDNGIGRNEAQIIKKRQNLFHKSFSVNATKGRFEIMKSHYKQNLGVFYEDLEEGTKVIVQMPFKQKF